MREWEECLRLCLSLRAASFLSHGYLLSSDSQWPGGVDAGLLCLARVSPLLAEKVGCALWTRLISSDVDNDKEFAWPCPCEDEERDDEMDNPADVAESANDDDRACSNEASWDDDVVEA